MHLFHFGFQTEKDLAPTIKIIKLQMFTYFLYQSGKSDFAHSKFWLKKYNTRIICDGCLFLQNESGFVYIITSTCIIKS